MKCFEKIHYQSRISASFHRNNPEVII